MQLEKSIMGTQETFPMPRLLTLAADSVKELIYSFQTFMELPEFLMTIFVNYDCGYSKAVTGVKKAMYLVSTAMLMTKLNQPPRKLINSTKSSY